MLFCYVVNILDAPPRHHCKVTLLALHKMVTWRTLVWLCMIFTVWPMRMGLLGLRQGVWGEQRIISVGCLENNKALEARERVSTWLAIEIHRMDEMVLFASKMFSVDWKYRVLPLQI